MEILKIFSAEFTAEQIAQIEKLLVLTEWSERQIEGQINALKKLAAEGDGVVLLAIQQGRIIGYIAAQFYSWNRLGQIHGLVIHPKDRKKGYASRLVKEIESFMKTLGARGLYADTPVDNLPGCSFYPKNGFKKDYVMTEYYDEGKDGVTFLKLFHRSI